MSDGERNGAVLARSLACLHPAERLLWSRLLAGRIADERSRFWKVAGDDGLAAATHNAVAGFWLVASVATMVLGLAARASAGALLQIAAVVMLAVVAAHLVARQRAARRHHDAAPPPA